MPRIGFDRAFPVCFRQLQFQFTGLIFMSDEQQGLQGRIRAAVQHFWGVRETQGTQQGGEEESQRDRGARTKVTGGKHLDGFRDLIRDLLVETGLSVKCIHCESKTVLPGWYRATKNWDFLVLVEDRNKNLIAIIELKSIASSFGNNLNNRAEEAIGNATDLWAAYREGAFKPSIRPWLGFLMIMADSPTSRKQVSVTEPHFSVFEEFRGASYVERCRLLLQRLVRERLYDSACLLLSKEETGQDGDYSEPDEELSFLHFVESLRGKVLAHTSQDPLSE